VLKLSFQATFKYPTLVTPKKNEEEIIMLEDPDSSQGGHIHR